MSLTVTNNFSLPQRIFGGERCLSMLETGKKNSLVLLFSREYEIRILLQAFLKVWNYELCEADDEKELVQTAEKERPALILFDMSREFEEDLKIIRRARATPVFSNLPILVLSGHARSGDSITTLQAGASEYLLKPIDFGQLENSINRYCSADGTASDGSFGVNL